MNEEIEEADRGNNPIERVDSSIKIAKNVDGSFEIVVTSAVCSLNALKDLVSTLKKEFIDTQPKSKNKNLLGIG